MSTGATDTEQPLFAGFPPSGSTLCPRCDYDLQHLPAVHRCPECGFEYDSNTRVWRDVSWRRRLKRCLNIVLPVLAALLFLFSMHQFWSGNEHLGFNSLWQGAIICFAVVATNQAHTISIAPAGILRRRSLFASKCRSWAEIEDAVIEFNGRHDIVQLLNDKRKAIYSFDLNHLFTDRDDCERVLLHYIDLDVKRRGNEK